MRSAIPSIVESRLLTEKSLLCLLWCRALSAYQAFTTLLALILTALIVFVIANSFPIVKIELQGNISETTLLGAVWVMFHYDRAFVGVLILITTFIVPLTYLLLLGYVLGTVSILKKCPQF